MALRDARFDNDTLIMFPLRFEGKLTWVPGSENLAILSRVFGGSILTMALKF